MVKKLRIFFILTVNPSCLSIYLHEDLKKRTRRFHRCTWQFSGTRFEPISIRWHRLAPLGGIGLERRAILTEDPGGYACEYACFRTSSKNSQPTYSFSDEYTFFKFQLFNVHVSLAVPKLGLICLI